MFHNISNLIKIICRTSFAVGEILLLIGLSVESGHLKNWGTPRTSCLILGQGLFSAAGIFGLVTVIFAAGLYITSLRAERILHDQQNIRREIYEASVLYASPPRSPDPPMAARLMVGVNENPITRPNHNQHTLAHYLSEFEKYTNLIV